MPLIVISGLPSSGKTTIAKQLKEYFEQNKKLKTKIISEQAFYNAGEDRNTVYTDPNKEKRLRASMKSEVERHLSTNSILIFDSLNYVKGFRYELFCVSKCNSTTQCTIHCDISMQDAKVVNERRGEEEAYTHSVLEELFMRYEVPDGKNRWDSPLFYIPLKIINNNMNNKDNNNDSDNNNDINKSIVSDKEEIPVSDVCDDFNDMYEDSSNKKNDVKVIVSWAAEERTFEAVHDCLMLKKSPKPHLSTATAPILPMNFLHEVDNITKAVVQEILEKQKNCVPGDSIRISSSSDSVHFLKTYSMAELQRIRRQYVAFSRNHPISTPSLIPSSFVQYVNSRSEI